MKFTYLALMIIMLVSCYTPTETTYTFDPTPDLSDIEYEGGDGTSLEEAIIIKNAKNSTEGIAAEYAYLEKKYGIRNVDWQLKSQSTINENDSHYDLLTIEELNSKEVYKIYFNISEFYGDSD